LRHETNVEWLKDRPKAAPRTWCFAYVGSTKLCENQSVDLDSETVSIERAAEVLGVAPTYFLKLLRKGAVPSHTAGGRVQVYLRDVLTFARKRDDERRAALGRLSRAAVDLGLYECNRFPDDGQDE
jgi:excisionase family DNA binding protein